MRVRLSSKLPITAVAVTALVLLMMIMLMGIIVAELIDSVTLTGEANTTFHDAQGIVWTSMGLLAIGLLILVVVAIIGLFRGFR